jgi:hypothetical protein
MDYIRIHAIAARQLGLITLAQIESVGGSISVVKTAIESGRWQRLQAGVYLTGSAPPT